MKRNRLTTLLLTAALLTGCAVPAGTSAPQSNAEAAAPTDQSGAAEEETADAAEETEAAAGEEAAEVTKVLVATSSSQQPYAFVNENDELVGYEIELLYEIFSRLPQYEVEYVYTDWDSILTGLDSGIYTMSAECIFYSDDRAEKYYFSDPISYDPIVAVRNTAEEPITSIDDLAGKTIPGGAGTIWTIAASKYNEEHPDNQIGLDYTGLDYFHLWQRVDEQGDLIMMTDYGSASSMLQRNPFEHATFDVIDADSLEGYVDKTYTYLLFSRYGNNEQLIADINKELRAVQEEGIATELSKKYFNGQDLAPVNNGFEY